MGVLKECIEKAKVGGLGGYVLYRITVCKKNQQEYLFVYRKNGIKIGYIENFLISL